MGRVEGKVALITGAARGQGRAHALTLAREGADVALLDIGDQSLPGNLTTPADRADLDEAVREVEALGAQVLRIEADVSDEDQVEKAVSSAIERFGRLDVVVANAAVFDQPKPLAQTAKEDWDALLATDLTGVWLTLKHVTPHLQAQGGGSIIVISSAAGLKPFPYMGSYSVAKAGLRGLVNVAANELGPMGIRVNSVHPGSVDTPGLQSMLDLAGINREEAIEGFLAKQIFPRFLQSQDVANAVLFLASDESSGITGVELPVDAGWCAKG